MILEAMNRLQELAAAGSTVNIVTLPEPDRYAIQHGEELTFVNRPAATRTHTIDNLTDLVRFAVAHQATSIWHDGASVTVLFDDFRRLDRVSLAIVPTELLSVLLSWPRPYPQGELIWLLRTSLADVVEPDLRGPIEKINFRKVEENQSDQRHAYAKLGFGVELEAIGAGPLPETFEVELQPWCNVCADFTTVVRCVLGIDLQERRFQLAFAGNELAAALDAAHAFLRQRIEDLLADADPENAGRCAVYQGTP